MKENKTTLKTCLKWTLGVTLLCGTAAMLYVHRHVIAAAIRGEALPECPHHHGLCHGGSEDADV